MLSAQAAGKVDRKILRTYRSCLPEYVDGLAALFEERVSHLMGIGFAGFLEENCDLEITCPTVILVGEHDRTGKVKQYCDAWHRKTQFPLYRIPDAAHNSNFDNSDVVNRIIESFVQDIRI